MFFDQLYSETDILKQFVALSENKRKMCAKELQSSLSKIDSQKNYIFQLE